MWTINQISKKFQKAAAIYIEKNFREGEKWKFIRCLIVVWPEGREDRFKVLDQFLIKHFIELCGDRVRVTDHQSEIRASVLHQGGKFLWINISTGYLEAMKTEGEFKKEFHRVIGSIYHECDHVSEEGSDSGDCPLKS